MPDGCLRASRNLLKDAGLRAYADREPLCSAPARRVRSGGGAHATRLSNADPLTEHDHGPGDWVLLAEVGGEGLTEGELGVVYWVIRRDDLAGGRFTRARACFDMVG